LTCIIDRLIDPGSLLPEEELHAEMVRTTPNMMKSLNERMDYLQLSGLFITCRNYPGFLDDLSSHFRQQSPIQPPRLHRQQDEHCQL
jgi:hypothetical protein